MKTYIKGYIEFFGFYEKIYTAFIGLIMTYFYNKVYIFSLGKKQVNKYLIKIITYNTTNQNLIF